MHTAREGGRRMDRRGGTHNRAETGMWLSLAVYAAMALGKLAVGFAAHSTALQADGWNNATDLLALAAVLVGLKYARKPPDADHPYGHWRAETIAAFVVALLMIGVGLDVLSQAAVSLLAGHARTPDGLAAWAALASAAVAFLLYRRNRQLAAQTANEAVRAAAMDNRSDALISLGTAGGVLGARLGLTWLDPLLAAAIGVAILKTAIDIGRKAVHALSDGVDAALLARLSREASETPGVERVKSIRARIHGRNRLWVDLTICVRPDLSVVDSHRITEDVERRLQAAHPVAHVHVHVEPHEMQADPTPSRNPRS